MTLVQIKVWQPKCELLAPKDLSLKMFENIGLACRMMTIQFHTYGVGCLPRCE